MAQPLSMRDVENAVQKLRQAVGYQNPEAAEAIAILRQNALDVEETHRRLVKVERELRQAAPILLALAPIAGAIDGRADAARYDGAQYERRVCRFTVMETSNPYREGTPRWKAFERARSELVKEIE